MKIQLTPNTSKSETNDRMHLAFAALCFDNFDHVIVLSNRKINTEEFVNR